MPYKDIDWQIQVHNPLEVSDQLPFQPCALGSPGSQLSSSL